MACPKEALSIPTRSTAICLLVACLTIAGCGGKEPPPPGDTVKTVKIMTIAATSELASREFPGQVQAAESAEMSFRVAGRLIEFPIAAGQKVEAGAVLAKLDPRDFQSRVDSVSSSLSEAEAQVTAMKARVSEADVQFGRIEEMVSSGIAPASDLDKQRRTRDVAKADTASAQENVNSLKAQLREAEGSLDDTTLLAPFDGVIARTFVENFEHLQAKQPVVLLQNDAIVEITISIAESDMVRADKEAGIEELANNLEGRAHAKFAGLAGRQFPVMLKDYETEADPETQTFAVTVALVPPAGVSIRSGMNATVTITASEDAAESQILQVPVTAVIAGASGESIVWRIDDDGRVAPIEVEVGSLIGDSIQILSGLQPGDRIATSATNSLREGMTVRALNTGVKD